MPKIYKNLIRPILFRLPAETVHELGIESLKLTLGSKTAQDYAAKRYSIEEFGELSRFGLKFVNPIGVAAGFDKNAVVVNQLAALGFGFVEVGTMTFNPQKGNEKPRLFRLPEDKALINRLGFNNEGTAKIVERLRKINPNCVLGVNIGKNKDVSNEQAVENYLRSFELVHEIADYIAVNVSSPNTPNLRELQNADNLENLLSVLQKKNQELSPKPLLVKIAPDLSDAEIEAIIGVALKLNLAGIIATNTTIKRDNLKSSINQTGGLSGKPLQKKSNEIISKIYKLSKGKLPVIGVGGIFTAEDAFEKILCGAALLQAYTGFIYHGVSFARDINSGLVKILRKKGFENLDEAVGQQNKL
jgi:dihydroorotate dehydrogenase